LRARKVGTVSAPIRLDPSLQTAPQCRRNIKP
jgi:hypothetical protein